SGRARPRRIRRAHRRRGARWIHAPLEDRRDHSRARARARDRRPRPHPERPRRRSRRARLSLGARRQGPRDRDGRAGMRVAAATGTERIARAFARAKAERRLAVVIYLTVGYPDRTATAPLLRAALEGGADVLELGVPFSDPLAD